LARLSVFAGPFNLRAAEEVCAEVEPERPDVVEALIGLVDKSVVLREGDTYRMLDTIRDFGAELLAASGERASCRARHITRYLGMARYFGAHFADDDQMDRYRELRAVHSNVRAALEYALELEDGSVPADPGARPGSGAGSGPGAGPGSYSGAVATAVRLERWRSGADIASSLYGYWQISGLLGEGGYWLTKALDRFPDAGTERARALVTRGFLRSFQGDHANALDDCEVGTAMALALDADDITARGYQHMQLTLTFLGRHDEALKATDEAALRLRAVGDRAGELMLAAQLGHLHHLRGRPEIAVNVCEEGLKEFGPPCREQWVTTYLYFVYGMALFQMPGREADCDRMLRRALAGKSELGDVIGMAYALDVLGWLALKTGTPARTAWLLGAAEPLWERGGSVRFSGTAIMEEFHQQAAAATAALLGADTYASTFDQGAAYVRGRLAARVGEGALRLEIPG
jgi:non-specific serine/threonine protein kinase